jgi:hypothetical protein
MILRTTICLAQINNESSRLVLETMQSAYQTKCPDAKPLEAIDMMDSPPPADGGVK